MTLGRPPQAERGSFGVISAQVVQGLIRRVALPKGSCAPRRLDFCNIIMVTPAGHTYDD